MKNRQLLTKNEFKEKIKPNDEMTYWEIKNNIFNWNKLWLVLFKDNFERKIQQIGANINEKWIYVLKNESIFASNSEYSILFKNFLVSYLNLKHSIIESYKDTYISSNYEHYIFSKFQNLQNSFIWTQCLLDKMFKYICFFEQEKWEKFCTNSLSKIKDVYINNKLTYICNKYKNSNSNDHIKIDNIFFNKFANNVKHNIDSLIEKESILISWDISDIERISFFFYNECLYNLILFHDDIVTIMEEIIDYKYNRLTFKINIR